MPRNSTLRSSVDTYARVCVLWHVIKRLDATHRRCWTLRGVETWETPLILLETIFHHRLLILLVLLLPEGLALKAGLVRSSQLQHLGLSDHQVLEDGDVNRKRCLQQTGENVMSELVLLDVRACAGMDSWDELIQLQMPKHPPLQVSGVCFPTAGE